MLKNSLAYFVSWILLQLLVKVNCQMMRTRHTATLIDNKLYILGGITANKEFLYLDFSDKFNTKNLLWHNLTSINTVPPHRSAASVKGGANNNTLFLFGGNNETMALVYTFDPQSNTWSTPTTASDININRKEGLLGIIDYNGKMYLWGGLDHSISDTVNDMLILDTINLSWEKGSLVGVPTARYHYGATLLPNQSIIYMGGYPQGASLLLNQVYIYDTINDNWSAKTTSGKIPSARGGFSVVLGLDGQRVILFGGTSTATTDFISGDSLYVLNLINFEWYIPKISGQIPNSRDHHKANVIGKFMVISFGLGYSQSNESDILLLDISNNNEYVWTNDFIPQSTQANSPNNPQQSDNLSLSKASVAGAIVGLLIGGILISFGCFFLYKWNKNKQNRKNTLPIPGNENREGMFSLTVKDSYNSRQENIQSNLIPINNSYNYGQEVSQIPRNESTTNHEPIIISAPVINHGQEAIPITNDERLSTQNMNDLKNEIKQEIIREMLQNLQNNVQASSSNNSDK